MRSHQTFTKTLTLATLAAALLLMVPAYADQASTQPEAVQAVEDSAPLAAVEQEAQAPALSVEEADLPEWLAAGPRGEVNPAIEPNCYAVSNYCSQCSGGKLRNCTRYKCWVGPDYYYTTSCGSCYPYC